MSERVPAVQPNTQTINTAIAGGYAPASSTSQFIEAGGLRLHYLDYGTAGRRPMLCVHGRAANAHWFDFVAGSFVGDYHVRAIDHRGHGDSAWADPQDYSYDHFAAELNEIATRLDLRDFILIGHSMGGKTSLNYAATYPGRVAKLVVIDSNMDVSVQRQEQMRRLGRKERKPYATREEYVANFHVRPRGSNAAPEIARHIAYHCCVQKPEGGWGHKFDNRVHTEDDPLDALACWESIKVPALLIKAELSARITPEIRAAIQACCPKLNVVDVPDSHHHVTLDNPAGCVRAISEFLRRSD